MEFTALNRQHYIQSLASQTFDLLIIGGGITGAGIALDATLRGMKTALVEMQDFAAGTSSRSTKLIHGGLRYLKQGEIRLVSEVGKEREIVYENGPHVTSPEWMLLPIYKDGTFGRFATSIGLRLYDFLAGVKKSERRRMLSPQETIEKERLLKRSFLQRAGYYVEYRTDDARLTIEVIKAAVQNGATCLNYAKAETFNYSDDNEVNGIICVDQLTDRQFPICAKKIVNASGPWVDTIREKDGSRNGKGLQLSKGVHIVIDQHFFPLNQAVYFDTLDGRMVFAIPRNGKVYVGTTDTFYKKDPINPRMTVHDRRYLIDSIHHMFPKVNIHEEHIESSWAGVRPLILEEGKDPSEISRKDEIWQSDSGLITIAGGKLTGYRKMAEVIVDLIAKKYKKEEDRKFIPCKTKHFPISGGNVGGSTGFKTFKEKHTHEGMKIGLTLDEASHLSSVYGSNVKELFKIIASIKSKETHAKLPILLLAKLHYALKHEMAVTPMDFFMRRTDYCFFGMQTVKRYKTVVINYMATFFQWSGEEIQKYTAELEQVLQEAVSPLEKEQ